MKLKKFNLIASFGAFLLGTAFLFTDGVGITANVIGATGNGAGITALIGMIMIIGSIGLFIVSMSGTDNHTITLERLMRRTDNRHTSIYQAPKQEPDIEMHKMHDSHKKD